MPSGNMPPIKTVIQLSKSKTPRNSPYPALPLYIAQITTIDNSIILLCLAHDAADHMPHTPHTPLRSTTPHLAGITQQPHNTTNIVVSLDETSFDMHVLYPSIQHESHKPFVITF